MTDNTLADQKTALRKQLKIIRTSIPASERKTSSEKIFNLLINIEEIICARTVFIYISYGNEVDTHHLLKYFIESGKVLAVPKILPSKTMIAVPFSGWDDLIPGELGILTPRGEDTISGNIDIAITPGLGFTRTGQRIGYGRGYYDQWFSGNSVAHKIALSFEAQILDSLPVTVTDIPVDIIVTEQEIIRI